MAHTLLTLILGSLLAQPGVAWYSGLRVCFVESEGSSQCKGTRNSCSGKLYILFAKLAFIFNT